MKRKLLLSFALAGLAMASAKSYTVNLFQSVKVGNTALEPGEYKVEVVDQKAVIRNGRMRGEVPVKVENGETRYDRTIVRLSGNEGTPHIQEIRLGGTKTKLVFTE